MKNYFLILSVIGLIATSCSSDNRKSFSDAKEYNDYIVGELAQLNDDYNSSVNASTLEESEKNCQKLKSDAERTLANLNIQPFEGDSSLCVAARQYAQHMVDVANKEMTEAFKLHFKLDRTPEETEKFNALVKFLDEDYNKHRDEIIKVQKEFADKHDMILM
jgi:hypothetical protein